MNLDDLIQEDLEKGIKLVLSGEQEEYEFKYSNLGSVVQYLKKEYSAKHSNNDNLDTNGWQWDWWDKITVKDKVYGLSGSGYYGGVTFSTHEE